MFKSKQSLLVVLLFCASVVMAQERTINGTVTDAAGKSPLPGVSISVKGWPTMALTNDNGHFAIRVPAGRQTLVFTFVNFTTKGNPKESILAATGYPYSRAYIYLIRL